MDPLGLKADQAWLALGVTGFLAARYSAPIIGVQQDELIAAMTADRRRNTIRAATIDLLHPTPASNLREQYVPLYLDAMRRKSTLVVQDWVAQAGDDAIPKTLAALRQTKPADGPALLKLIQQTTGVDLSQNLAPAQYE
jgi:hypothetical protein